VAAKINGHRYGTKLLRCRPLYSVQVKQLCSARQTLRILATQIVASVAIAICLELMRTDFERAQLKYYNFPRASDIAEEPRDAPVYCELLPQLPARSQ